MKKQILLALLFLIHFLAKSQELETHIDTVDNAKPTFIDDSPAGLGITIGDNQRFKEEHYPDVLISKPTIIEMQKNKNGVFYIKAYANADHFNVVVANLKKNNYQNYEAFYQVYVTGEIPAINEKRAQELGMYYNEWMDLVYLQNDDMSNSKFFAFKYFYFIKEKKTGKVVSKMVLDFNFPKPAPLFITSEEFIVNTYETRPGEPLSGTPEFIEYYRNKEKIKKLTSTFFAIKTNLPELFILPDGQNTLLIQFKSLDSSINSYLEYKLDSDSTFKTSGKNYNPFLIFKDLAPGRHTLQVRYPRQQDAVFTYEFEVEPSFTQTAGFKILLASVFSIFLIGGIFSIKLRRQKKQLQAENAKRAQAQMQISGLRAQLNPHFVFNALNSIQGLVNKNDQEGANIYISKFGSLMRDILDKNDKATHALAQELKQLEDYLQLEQLRFQFNYQIILDETINPTEQDFPVMLLQPFAENAIKHGISGKKDAGNISIGFKRNTNDLQVIIKDNGQGFDTTEPANGYGIKLIKERIAVLNQLYKEQPISCEFISDQTKGTTVIITLTNWL